MHKRWIYYLSSPSIYQLFLLLICGRKDRGLEMIVVDFWGLTIKENLLGLPFGSAEK